MKRSLSTVLVAAATSLALAMPAAATADNSATSARPSSGIDSTLVIDAAQIGQARASANRNDPALKKARTDFAQASARNGVFYRDQDLEAYRIAGDITVVAPKGLKLAKVRIEEDGGGDGLGVAVSVEHEAAEELALPGGPGFVGVPSSVYTLMAANNTNLTFTVGTRGSVQWWWLKYKMKEGTGGEQLADDVWLYDHHATGFPNSSQSLTDLQVSSRPTTGSAANFKANLGVAPAVDQSFGCTQLFTLGVSYVAEASINITACDYVDVPNSPTAAGVWSALMTQGAIFQRNTSFQSGILVLARVADAKTPYWYDCNYARFAYLTYLTTSERTVCA